MRDNNDSKRFQRGGVFLISFCHFVHDIFTSFFSALLPLLVEKLSMSLTAAGFLGTIMQLSALVNPIIGKWADGGKTIRWFIILAPSFTAIPMSLLGFAPSYSVLVLLLFMVGISSSLFHVPAPVMVARFSGNRKGLGMSFFMIGGELARTIGPITAVGAVSLWGLKGYYPVMSVGLLSSVLIYFRFKNLPITFLKKKPVSLKTSWREIKKIMMPLSCILVARGFMHGALTIFLPIFIKQETGSLWLAGAGLALYEASGVLGIFSSGSLSDRLGRRRVLFYLLSAAPCFLFLFVCLPGTLKVPALFCTGFTLLSTTPVMLAMVQEYATENPSAANGFFTMASFIARSAVIVLVGISGDFMGLTATYYACAFLGLFSIPFLFMLPGRKENWGRTKQNVITT